MAAVPAQPLNHETLMNRLRHDHVATAVPGEHSISLNAQRDRAMTYNDKPENFDPQMIIMGLGYATSLIVVIGWIATLIV
jgi:hypothetical protein